MVYRNKLTGAEFTTDCEIHAENYEAISTEVASPVVEEKPKVEKKAPAKKKGTKK